MPRLIDADKLLDILDVMIVGHKSASDVYDVVDSMPTVDAEPVVRCKDCKWCSVDRYADGNVPDYVCINMDCGVEADGFCSWGERREDETN